MTATRVYSVRCVCGAAIGALLVLGLARCDEECSPESRHRVMGSVDEFHERFRARVGALDCPDILVHDVREPEQRAQVEAEGLRVTVCLHAVRAAAEVLGELLDPVPTRDDGAAGRRAGTREEDGKVPAATS